MNRVPDDVDRRAGGFEVSKKYCIEQTFWRQGGQSPPCDGRLAQLVRASVSHTEGHVFESHTAHFLSNVELAILLIF